MKKLKAVKKVVKQELVLDPTPRHSWETCPQDYIDQGVLSLEPMTAKEENREDVLNEMLDSPDVYAEEKYDGTRCLLHFSLIKEHPFKSECRLFSRRVSKKTGWYSENTDSMPLIRDISIPELNGTVIDGELFIPNRPFKDVSGTLNCKYDKAIERQKELGNITLHAFDILRYKGIDVTILPLWKRKEYLQEVISSVEQHYSNPPIVMAPYSLEGFAVKVSPSLLKSVDSGDLDEVYPNFVAHVRECGPRSREIVLLNKRAYYEYIVLTGGEGIILKHKTGNYYHKRGREYTKLKKFLTRECIVIGFTEPTHYYEGKHEEDWEYWEDRNEDLIHISDAKAMSLIEKQMKGCKPVTKHHYYKWIGNVIFGVIVTPEEKEKLLKSKKGKTFEFTKLSIQGPPCNDFHEYDVLTVGECAGFDEEEREHISNNLSDYECAVVEIKANEIFKDTGKLRHPRFLRWRTDKNPEECTWEDHINVFNFD